MLFHSFPPLLDKMKMHRVENYTEIFTYNTGFLRWPTLDSIANTLRSILNPLSIIPFRLPFLVNLDLNEILSG